MQSQFKFRMSVVALGVLAVLGSGRAMAQTTYLQSDSSVQIWGNNDSSASDGEGVFITSNSGLSGAVPQNQAYLQVLTNGQTTIGGRSSVNITSPTVNINGNLTSSNLQSIATVTITGNTDNIGAGEGVVIKSSGNGSGGNISVLDTGVSVSGGLNNIGNTSSTNTVVGTTNINASGHQTTNIATTESATTNIGVAWGENNLAGKTNINASVDNFTNINTGTSTGVVTIGNALNTTNLNSATNNIGVNAFATVNNIGTNSAAASTNSIGNTNTGTSVTTTAGASSITTTNAGNAIVGRAGNTMTATTGSNTITGQIGNTLTATTGGNVLGAATTNALTGGTGNSITATTGNNAMIASAGNNNITASLINNIEAPTNNIGVATAASINNIGNSASSTNTIKGVTSINASINAATNINTGASTSVVTIGNTGLNASNTVNAFSGNTAMSLANNTASLTAGRSLATNGTAGTTAGTGSGGLTIYNAAQTIANGTTIPSASSPNGILAGNTYQNKINGNLLVDGNVFINGTLNYVSSNSANTSVVGSTAAGTGGSILTGANTATAGGTAIVLKGATGAQTVVDANGKLTNVVGTATQSTVALTLTNGIGNTHGLVITETQASLSGGTQSSTLTMGDNGGTFSDAQTGAPVQVHGVNDGTSSFDAVNVRQFSGAIASVTALANIPQEDQDKTFAVGVGMGSFMGQTAIAAGVTYRFTRNGVLKGSISSAMNSSQTTAVGVGAAWSY